jgi:hypothetical protein
LWCVGKESIVANREEGMKKWISKIKKEAKEMKEIRKRITIG